MARTAARFTQFVALPLAIAAFAPACSSDDSSSADDSSADEHGGSSGSAASDAGTHAGSGGSAGKSGSGGSNASSAASDASAPSGDKSTAGLVGDFKLELVAATEATASTMAVAAVSKVLGQFNDGPEPSKDFLTQTDESGGCTLYKTGVKPLCDQACAAMNAVCTGENTCTPNPTSQDVGVVHLTAGSNAVDVKLVAKNYQLTAADPKLPYPPCDEGEAVRIEASGGEYQSFAIETKCIAPLEVDGPFAIESGKPLALRWNTPGDGDIARMQIRLDISHHGGKKGEIQCETDDDGEFEIPASLIDGLLDLGVAGFPTVQLTRIAVGHASTPEPSQATLSVAMFAERDVTIPGLVSCNTTDRPCPDGQVCQTDLSCK